MDREIAIVTGASSGLGAAFARNLAQSYPRFDLLLVARRTERLSQVSEEIRSGGFTGNLQVLTANLLESADLTALVDHVVSRKQSVGLLINNAGFGSLREFSALPLERELDMVELNVRVPLRLVSALLPQIQSSTTKTILNVCSTAAFQPMPFMATYGATKVFLRNWSLALGYELASTGVRVVAHCPGPTDTEFHTVVGLPEKLSFLPAASAESVAADALRRALVRHEPLIVSGVLNRAIAAVGALLPLRLSTAIVGRILRRFR